MKNKRIFSLFICVLTLMSSISVSANENIISIKTAQQVDGKFESENEIRIINAEHRSDGVEITGEVIDGIKGNQVGVIVRDKTNKIVYLSQETLGERDKFGNSPFNFYFKPANDFSDYTVTISAKGCSTEVDVIKKAEKREFYVSTDGNDANIGSLDAPFKTIEAARDAVRKYKAQHNGLLPIDVVVYIRGGEYILTSSLEFTDEDSGTNGKSITYTAYPNETPKLVASGYTFTNWTKDGNVWISEGGPDYKIESLNGNYEKQAINARMPNVDEEDANRGISQGYFKSNGIVENDTEVDNQPYSKSYFASKSKSNIPEIKDSSTLYVIHWPNGGTETSPNGHYNWNICDNLVREIYDESNLPADLGNMKVTSSISDDSAWDKVFYLGPTIYESNRSPSNYPMGNNMRYYLYGVEEFLDAPGEFYYNYNEKGNKQIKFIPNEDFEMTKDSVIHASAPFSAISIKGSAPDKKVKNVVISGLDISGSQVSNIKVENADNIEITKNKIHHSMGTGVSVVYYTSNVNIESNDIGYNEGGGVYIGDTQWKYGDRNVINNKVVNNHVYTVGEDSNCITTYNATHTLIAHNDVHDSPRAGIRIGSSDKKSYYYDSDHFESLIPEEDEHKYTGGCGNIIEYNNVYDCMKDSQDCGTIYAFQAHHNIYRYNTIHDSKIDLKAFNQSMNGFYLDNCSDYNYVYGNTIYGMGGENGGHVSALISANGIGNVIRDNIIADNEMHINNKVDTRTGIYMYNDSDNNVIENNIFYRTGRKIFGSYVESSIKSSTNNIIYDDLSKKNDVPITDDTSTNAKLSDDPESAKSYLHKIMYNNRSNMENINLSLTFDEWTNNYQQDTNTIFNDPLFINSKTNDYRFMPESPAYKLGFEEINRQDIGLRADFPFYQSAPYDKIFIKKSDSNVNSGTLFAMVGDIIYLSTLVRNNKNFIEKNTMVTFKSDKPEIASVDNKGKVNVIGCGTAKITASVGDICSDIYIVSERKRVSFKDADGNAIDKINDNKYVTAAIDTSGIESTAFMPMLALFNNKEFITVELNFKKENEIYEATIDLSKINVPYTKIRVFCWEPGTLRPLIKCEELVK